MGQEGKEGASPVPQHDYDGKFQFPFKISLNVISFLSHHFSSLL